MLTTNLYTAEEAAEFLGYHPEHVRRLARQGKLKRAARIGPSYLFDRATLEAWREARLQHRLPDDSPDA